MKARNIFLVVFSVLLVLCPFSTASADQQNTPTIVATRTASFDVKVVLVGFDETLIDKDYLTWNSPERRYQLFQIPGVSTGTEYSLNYEFVFPGTSFTDDFVQFLHSRAKTEFRQNVIWNISFFKIKTAYYWNYTHFPVDSTNTYYPADEVEAWLVEHESDYGGFPENGYVLVLADLSNYLPSTTFDQFGLAFQGEHSVLSPHFYNKTYYDSDLGIELYRRFMTAWGGHSRLFFADLSAGPEETAEQLPIQLASAVNSIDFSSSYGRTWLNQFLSDYVWGGVQNLFTPDFVYPINYASSYKIKVAVIDCRTDTADPPIEETFDEAAALEELQTLVPWAQFTAETRYARASDYPELEKMIDTSMNPGAYGLPPESPSVDARPIYEWLTESGQGHIKDFMEVRRDLQEFDIPVFAFAFDGEYEFGFTYKEMVARELDFDRTIWGVALYDLVLISHSSHDFKRGDFADPLQPGKGFGFTNTVIHEVGHMLGLMHPFGTSYDPTENFVASVMAYYPYEYGFSIFDKDALARGQADLLLRETAQLLAQTPFVFINAGDMSDARGEMDQAEDAYSSMNYADAVKNAADALVSAGRARLVGVGFIPPQFLGTLQAIGAFILGVFVAYLVFRKRKVAPSTSTMRPQTAAWCTTCGKQLTWIPEYARWYCFNCQKYQ